MQKTCIILPCYNEEKRLSIKYFQTFYQHPSSELIDLYFVNDGSTDNTLNVLHRLCRINENHMKVYDMPENAGKAEAVRKSVLKVSDDDTYGCIGYFDGDLSTPLEEAFLLLENLDKNTNFQVAFGSRIKRMGASINRYIPRHYLGRVFATAASILLNLPVYDTQCGAKLFNRELANRIFREKFISRWLFDIELFARIIELFGMEETKKMMIEVPLNRWVDRGDSKITAKDIMKVPFEFLKIGVRYKT